MEVYYCKYCKYHTKHLSHFKKHLKTQIHECNIEKNNIVDTKKINNIVNFDEFKQIIYSCDRCHNVYLTKRSLNNHTNLCKKDFHVVSIENENKNLKKEIKEKNNQLKTKDNQLNKVIDIAHDNSKTANTSMNILRYAKLYLNNVKPLEQLEGDSIYNVMKYKNPERMETINEQYVKVAIHKFNHNIFANFIGDMIIEHYIPKSKKDANVIATDTSRLCFIIMQKINKKKDIEKVEWMNDKSGKKFTELVLEPLINAVKDTLTEFIEFKKTKELNENNLCLMGKCVELKRDIEVNKFIKPILKYVAPSFHFDKLKIMDNDVECAEEKNKIS